MIVKGYIYTYLYIFLILGIASLLYKKGNGTYTRKIIHIGVSFSYVIFYKYFGNSIHIIIPPITFIILNYISYKKGTFKTMEEINSPGTVYYAISSFILALITYLYPAFYPYFGIGLFVMAFGDGFAPIIGKNIKGIKIYKDKTLAGSITVMIISLIVILIFNQLFSLNYNIWKIGLISIVSVFLEIIGKKGLDNLSLPLGVALVSFLLGVI